MNELQKLQQQNEDLKQKLERARRELNQCATDSNFFATHSGNEYAQRRGAEISKTLGEL